MRSSEILSALKSLPKFYRPQRWCPFTAQSQHWVIKFGAEWWRESLRMSFCFILIYLLLYVCLTWRQTNTADCIRWDNCFESPRLQSPSCGAVSCVRQELMMFSLFYNESLCCSPPWTLGFPPSYEFFRGKLEWNWGPPIVYDTKI